jgi:hypothetical protein
MSAPSVIERVIIRLPPRGDHKNEGLSVIFITH